MTIYVGDTFIAGGAHYKPSLFTTQWSDHKMYNVSWLRGDNFSWQSGTVYTAAYNELLSEYNSTDAKPLYTNFTKIGSGVTISSNGDATGFSTTSAIKTPFNIPSKPTSFEYTAHFTTGSSIDADGESILSSTSDHKGLADIVIYPSEIKIWISSNGSSCDIASASAISYAFNTYTSYYFKFIFNGSSYITKISTDNVTWTNLHSISSSATIYGTTPLLLGVDQTASYGNVFKGTLHLKDYSVVINGNTWWTADLCRITPKGYKICAPDKTDLLINKYNNDGIAWYYVLDTVNTRFKLPRTKYGFEGLRDNVGDNIDESLPNISGALGGMGNRFFLHTSSGPFQLTGANTANKIQQLGETVSSYQTYCSSTFNASRSSSVYKDGAHVQERATQMYLYFYVGEFTQEAIQQTAGITTEQLNAKVDVSSLTPLKGNISIPGRRRVALTLGASGTGYVAPANGMFRLVKRSSAAGQYMGLYPVPYYTDVGSSDCGSIVYSVGNSQVGCVTVNVLAGDTVWGHYNFGGDIIVFEFRYADGDP